MLESEPRIYPLSDGLPVGSLALIRHDVYRYKFEASIIEWSPSRHRVKVGYSNGNESWLATKRYQVIEVLKPKRKGSRAKK